MITASIVIYNTKKSDLDSVIKCYLPSKERQLFLIDNSSSNVLEKGKFNKNITYIFNNKNLGYGAAHNIAIKKAIEIGSDYHIVLNPDISFEPKVIEELVKYADEHKDVVYMLPKVLYPNGELQCLCKLLPTPADLIFRRFLPKNNFTNNWNDKYILKASGYNKIMNPPCLSGCFMFMRTSALKENNLFFDDRFFMYCEDFDLIRRLHRVGKTLYYPNVSIIHNHAQESYHSKKMLLQHIKSAIKYFNKYGWFFDRERRNMNNKILKELDLK